MVKEASSPAVTTPRPSPRIVQCVASEAAGSTRTANGDAEIGAPPKRTCRRYSPACCNVYDPSYEPLPRSVSATATRRASPSASAGTT